MIGLVLMKPVVVVYLLEREKLYLSIFKKKSINLFLLWIVLIIRLIEKYIYGVVFMLLLMMVMDEDRIIDIEWGQ